MGNHVTSFPKRRTVEVCSFLDSILKCEGAASLVSVEEQSRYVFLNDAFSTFFGGRIAINTLVGDHTAPVQSTYFYSGSTETAVHHVFDHLGSKGSFVFPWNCIENSGVPFVAIMCVTLLQLSNRPMLLVVADRSIERLCGILKSSDFHYPTHVLDTSYRITTRSGQPECSVEPESTRESDVPRTEFCIRLLRELSREDFDQIFISVEDGDRITFKSNWKNAILKHIASFVRHPSHLMIPSGGRSVAGRRDGGTVWKARFECRYVGCGGFVRAIGSGGEPCDVAFYVSFQELETQEVLRSVRRQGSSAPMDRFRVDTPSLGLSGLRSCSASIESPGERHMYYSMEIPRGPPMPMNVERGDGDVRSLLSSGDRGWMSPLSRIPVANENSPEKALSSAIIQVLFRVMDHTSRAESEHVIERLEVVRKRLTYALSIANHEETAERCSET